MTYYVIGLMSGSSHDGLDICYSQLTFISGKKWEYAIENTACVPYPTELKEKLKHASELSVPDFLKLDRNFARFCADHVNEFIQKNKLEHKVFFIVSHGHTVWHDPGAKVSSQIGDGATIAALTGYTTISDLRNMDIALGGQGAPIVPVADRLLFPDYDFCLNLGGIANLTINTESPLAFDICPANQLLDYFAQKQGRNFDENGQIAQQGTCNEAALAALNDHVFYRKEAPKSLNNSFSETEIIPVLEQESGENALNTSIQHIACQIAQSLKSHCIDTKDYKMLLTGGGAFNTYLVGQIQQAINESHLNVSCEVPQDEIVKFKESLAMSLIGVLRWREEENVFASVTGATRNSIGGAIWLGA